MREFKYNPPRVHNGELRTMVTFYKKVPNEGPMPGDDEEKVLFKAWAKVDRVWLKDLEIAKANGTLSDITITIRDTQRDYIPSNHHFVKVEDANYQDVEYNIKSVQPNLQDRRFIDIVAEVKKL
ncbi:phage head closure protein [Priestia flexa]|uniref:phage head closure protein n=1 Tax=Priestia flexa TaxID=86664 RepID=UPI00240DA53A|nr:phage head closure protein [Priestia flexa]WEZ09576.1 phage head closure protein [Priestia flexa]